jgi:hypothetical protein
MGKVFKMCKKCHQGFDLNHGGEELPVHHCSNPNNGGVNAHNTHTHQHAAGQGLATTGCGGIGHGSGGK